MGDWTEEDRRAIKKAIASGSKKVQYKDRQVEYRSLAELRGILREIEEELAGGKRPPRYIYPSHSKGLNRYG